jgi:hypothetical protein
VAGSLRGKSEKNCAGQVGHRGDTLRQTLAPDFIERHEAERCGAWAKRGASRMAEKLTTFDPAAGLTYDDAIAAFIDEAFLRSRDRGPFLRRL